MRSGDTLIKFITVIIFLALLAYMGFAVFDRFINPLETVKAVSLTVEDAIEVNGYAVREESVLDGPDSFVLVVSDGTKVSVGQSIAVEYSGESSLSRATRIREIKAQITQLENNSHAGKRSEAELASSSVIALSRAVQSRDMTDIEMSVAGVRTYIMGMYGDGSDPDSILDQLHTELNNLEREASADTSYIRADASGIFTSVVDGYEHVTVADLDDITPSSLSSLFKDSEADPDALGKLVTGIDWYFVASLPSEDVNRIRDNENHTIQFKNNFGESMKMHLDYTSPPEGGKCAVIFSSNKFVSDICSLREMTGDIMLSTFTGIRVPKNAIHYDENNVPFVYILAGLQARRADVELKEDVGDFWVVSVEDGSLLRVDADIITKARDLFDGKVVK